MVRESKRDVKLSTNEIKTKSPKIHEFQYDLKDTINIPIFMIETLYLVIVGQEVGDKIL